MKYSIVPASPDILSFCERESLRVSYCKTSSLLSLSRGKTPVLHTLSVSGHCKERSKLLCTDVGRHSSPPQEVVGERHEHRPTLGAPFATKYLCTANAATHLNHRSSGGALAIAVSYGACDFAVPEGDGWPCDVSQASVLVSCPLLTATGPLSKITGILWDRDASEENSLRSGLWRAHLRGCGQGSCEG